jgi:hypothetical protein
LSHRHATHLPHVLLLRRQASARWIVLRHRKRIQRNHRSVLKRLRRKRSNRMNRSDRNSVNVLRCSQRTGRPPSDALFFDSPHSLSGIASVAVVSPSLRPRIARGLFGSDRYN